MIMGSSVVRFDGHSLPVPVRVEGRVTMKCFEYCTYRDMLGRARSTGRAPTTFACSSHWHRRTATVPVAPVRRSSQWEHTELPGTRGAMVMVPSESRITPRVPWIP